MRTGAHCCCVKSQVYLIQRSILCYYKGKVKLIYLFWRSRNQAVLWFGGQTLFLSGAFRFFFRALCLRYDPQFSMYSEEPSVHIACAGLLWALSMLCMLIGIYQMLRKGPVIHQF